MFKFIPTIILKLVKCFSMLEFVVSCQNDFHTLLLSEVESFKVKNEFNRTYFSDEY